MLPAFASIDDLTARRQGGVRDGERSRAQAALEDASALIRTEVGNDYVDTTGDTPVLLTTVPDIFLSVTCSAARRALDNPDGLQAETLGPWSGTYANSSGDVYLTTAERRLVRKGAGVSQVFTLATTRDPDCLGLETPPVTLYGPTGAEFVDVDPLGEPILWGGQSDME